MTAEAAPSSPSAHAEIPRVPGLPVVGNVVGLSGDVREFLTRSYQQFGPVFKVSALGREMIVLAGVEANKFAAREGSNVWRNWEAWHDVDLEFDVQSSVLSLDGPPHLALRKAMRRAFGRGYLAERLPLAYAVAAEDMAALRAGQWLPVVSWCRALIMEQLARVSVNSSSRPFLGDMLTFLQFSLMVKLIQAWPEAALHLPKYRWAKRNVFALADALIAQHRRVPPGQPGPSGQPPREPDLIDDLLDAQQANPEAWSHEDVRVGALNAFTAGLDTAASMLAFTLYRLHRHRDVLENVRAEADGLFKSGLPSLEDLGRAPQLHGAVLETLRLHPIAPALSRYAKQDFTFGGHVIPAGARLMLGSTVAHGLPDVYTDPETFDPTRFSPGRAEHRRAGVFHPFGVGSHTCLGSGMAEGMLLLNAASIVHCLDLHLEPNFQLKVRYQPAPCPTNSFKLHLKAVRNQLPEA